MSTNWRSSSSSGSGQSSSDSPLKSMRFASQAQGLDVLLSPGDNANDYQVIKPEDAQTVYPPACCVFVAKYVYQTNIPLSSTNQSNSLAQSESEESLQMAVTQIFREYGPVFVKIRRDAKQMPFAFCQYTVSL